MKNISNLQRLELIHLPTPKYKVAYYQCDQIWRNFTSLGQCYKTLVFWKGPFTIWQFIELTLANFIWFWANIQWFKWPNFVPENYPSGHTASHYVNELTKDCLSMAQVDRRWLEAPCFDYQCTFEARGPADRRGCRGRQSSFRKILTAAPWGSSGPWPWPSRTTFSRRSPCRSLLEVHCKCNDQYVTKNVLTRVGKWLAYQRWRSHTSSPIDGWPQLGTAM